MQKRVHHFFCESILLDACANRVIELIKLTDSKSKPRRPRRLKPIRSLTESAYLVPFHLKDWIMSDETCYFHSNISHAAYISFQVWIGKLSFGQFVCADRTQYKFPFSLCKFHFGPTHIQAFERAWVIVEWTMGPMPSEDDGKDGVEMYKSKIYYREMPNGEWRMVMRKANAGRFGAAENISIGPAWVKRFHSTPSIRIHAL